MLKRIAYSKPLKIVLKFLFGLVYDKKYLKGKYFDIKRMGWYWAFRGAYCKLIGDNRHIPWPVNPRTIVSRPDNIEFDIDDLHIFQTPGCYWQNHDGKIKIGKGCHVAPNVGIITTNHDIYNLEKHIQGKDVVIGNNSWIGMNAVVLPGVILGEHTIVGAGSVVTHSFPEGYCVIGGVPAKEITKLDKSKLEKIYESGSNL